MIEYKPMKYVNAYKPMHTSQLNIIMNAYKPIHIDQ